jgi:hypothetical protein
MHVAQPLVEDQNSSGLPIASQQGPTPLGKQNCRPGEELRVPFRMVPMLEHDAFAVAMAVGSFCNT